MGFLLEPFTPNNARRMNIGDVDLLAIVMGVIYWANASSGMIRIVDDNRNALQWIVSGGGELDCNCCDGPKQ